MNKQSLTLIASNQILALCDFPATGGTKSSSDMLILAVVLSVSTGLGGGPIAGTLPGGGPATGSLLSLDPPISTQCY